MTENEKIEKVTALVEENRKEYTRALYLAFHSPNGYPDPTADAWLHTVELRVMVLEKLLTKLTGEE